MATQCGDSGTQDLSTPDFSKPRIIPNDTKDKVNDFLEDELGMLTRLRTELGEYEAISSQASRNNHILEVERSRKVSVAEQLKKMEEMSAELEKVKVALDRIAAESSDTEI